MMMGLNKVQLDHQKSVVVDSKLVEMVVFFISRYILGGRNIGCLESSVVIIDAWWN